MARKIEGIRKSLGEFEVVRYLPSRQKKMVGPFIFVDQMGPAEFTAGTGINVRPHPHIGLATISYLFEGSMLHRDSLGSVQEVFPGDVNWMTAGKGIVHSERESLEVRSKPHNTLGVQCWVALPEDQAEAEPQFSHLKKNHLPHRYDQQTLYRIIAGKAYGCEVGLPVYSPLFYVDVFAAQHQLIELPLIPVEDYRDSQRQETAVLVIQGSIEVEDATYQSGDFVIIEDVVHAQLRTIEQTRLLILGGEAFSKIPLIDWNFVAHNEARLQQAKDDWANQRFAQVPGEQEFIPLPDL